MTGSYSNTQVALLGAGLVAEPFCVGVAFALEVSSSTILATLDTACAAASEFPSTTAWATSAAADAALIADVECFELEICLAVAPATAAATALAAMRLIWSSIFSFSAILSVLSCWRSENSTLVLGLPDAVSVFKSTDVDDSRLALFNT